nr:hypothetical protein [Snodgrassella alvi]
MLRIPNSVLFDYANLNKVNPQQINLKRWGGYYMNKSFGIRQIKDRYDNTLSYTHRALFIKAPDEWINSLFEYHHRLYDYICLHTEFLDEGYCLCRE